MKLQPVTNEFIFKELGQLNQNKSTGLDGISPRFLKNGAEILKVPIGHIVNLSLNTNIFPDDMKQAKITPLHKKKSRVAENNLIYEFQSGFRKKHFYQLMSSPSQ